MKPLVSICVPTYNRATTLKQTIQAVLNQIFQDWELVICDDASSDDTAKTVASFLDPRIRYYKNEKNLGLYPNWNRCISLASGKYVAIYHDHDHYLPSIVERSVKLLERHPEASFVHTALLMVDDERTPVAVDVRDFPELMSGALMRKVLANNWSSPIMAATAMVKREAYHQVGLYNSDLYGLGCDMDMWFRLAGVGDIAYVNEPQALIQVRRKSDATAKFSWSEVAKHLKMRREHLMQLSSEISVTRFWYDWTRYVVQRDSRLSSFMARSILLELHEVAIEGELLLNAEAGFLTKWGWRLVKKSAVFQRFLRIFLLPIHYKRVKRQEEHQRELARRYYDISVGFSSDGIG